MSGIEDDPIAGLADPEERAHIGDEIIVAESGASFGEEELIIAKGEEFFGDVANIPRSEELAFFDIDHPLGFGGGLDEIGLAAKEGGDLEDINPFGGDGAVLWGVDIGGHGDAKCSSDLTEHLAAFFGGEATEGFA